MATNLRRNRVGMVCFLFGFDSKQLTCSHNFDIKDVIC